MTLCNSSEKEFSMWIHDYLTPADNPFKDPPFVSVSHISYIDNQPQWQYPFHCHADAYELAWITSGKGALVLDDRRLPVTAGSVTVVPPGMLHYFSSQKGEDIHYFTLRFLDSDNPTELHTYFSELGPAAATRSERLPYINESWRVLLALHRKNGGIVDETFQILALGLIRLAKEVLSEQTPAIDAAEHELASQIMNYIMSVDGVGITLDSLAKTFSISPSHLSRIFSAAYHVSPINYAINARITYSTEYLLRTDMSVVEIAEKMGYDNPTHFSNMFIKRIGCTPTEFREKNRKMPGSGE